MTAPGVGPPDWGYVPIHRTSDKRRSEKFTWPPSAALTVCEPVGLPSDNASVARDWCEAFS
jgi:hypothetical protein